MKTNKKTLGQFFTDPVVAKFMVEIATDSKTKSFLDPTIGKGVFAEEISKTNRDISIDGFEIDKKIFDEEFADKSDRFCVKNANYLYQDLECKYDSIICNPPYNKFQKITDRHTLINIFKEKYGVKLSGYTNYCVYFLIKSLSEMNENGKCCYIIPYEFLNCGYGEIVKKYFLDQKKLKAIYKFNNKIKLFDDAITTSCILLFENGVNNEIDFINVESVDELEKKSFKSKISRKYEDLKYKDKWLQYFETDNGKEYNNLIKLSDVGKVQRGIATGNNKYFVLNKEKIKRLNLSEDVCLPCITKSQDVSTLKFKQEDFERLYNQNKNVFIFNGKNAKDKCDNEYISYGESKGYNRTYLTSHRNPWYAIEEKKAAPIFISVFNRNKLKVVKNETMVKNLSTFHSLYIKNQDLENLYFCYLITPTAQKILLQNKREYGEGLDKFEPNDLNNAYVLNMNIISPKDKEKVLQIYENITADDICLLDSIFIKYLKKDQIYT